jgi:hypothetical protein
MGEGVSLGVGLAVLDELDVALDPEPPQAQTATHKITITHTAGQRTPLILPLMRALLDRSILQTFSNDPVRYAPRQ